MEKPKKKRKEKISVYNVVILLFDLCIRFFSIDNILLIFSIKDVFVLIFIKRKKVEEVILNV